MNEQFQMAFIPFQPVTGQWNISSARRPRTCNKRLRVYAIAGKTTTTKTLTDTDDNNFQKTKENIVTRDDYNNQGDPPLVSPSNDVTRMFSNVALNDKGQLERVKASELGCIALVAVS